MSLPELFTRRPVLSTVLGALIMLLGLQGLLNLPVRQYPEVEETVVTITTTYPGASADLIQGFVTAPIARAVSTTENVDYVTSQSRPSVSTVTVQMQLGADPDVALTEVMSKVQQVRGQLPQEAEDPVIVKGTGQQFAIMYLAFQSEGMSPEQLTEYLERVIRPRMSTIEGVAEVQILGAANYAMRVWIDPVRLASRGVTASEVLSSINSSNFLSAPGRTQNELVTYSITLQSTLQTPEAFGALPIRADGDDVVRLSDVADVELAAESDDTIVRFNGDPGTFIGVFPTPAANPLDVAAGVLEELPELRETLPEGMTVTMVYDATETISASIEEVFKTIAEAVVIVVLVILLFLGSFRSVLMPIVTIPLSLVGVCFFLWAMGYSINLLSLLAMVLAIGLVVDDAIVVVENIHRHVDEGMKPLDAAIQGMREILAGRRRDVADARRGLRPDRVRWRSHRIALPGIRLHARRSRADLRHHRAHDHADDGGTPAEIRRAQPLSEGGGSHLRPRVELVRTARRKLTRLSPSDALDGRGARRPDGIHVHQDLRRAGTRGGLRRALLRPDGAALCDE